MREKMGVITYKNQGKSNRETARLTGLNRETVSKYWEEYKRKLYELSLEGADTKEIQDRLTSKPVYKTRNGKPRKYTEEMEERLKAILKSEARKDVILGIGHKQKMTNKQIHALLREEGYDIGIATVSRALARLRERNKQVYIRQQYGLGERLEYDFDDAQEYADSRLMKLNENSLIEEEKKALLEYRPPLELADIHQAKVDKTSLISVDCVKYSVPEEFVGRTLIVKKCHDEIRVFSGNAEVCRHRRAFGNGTMRINIMHYLNTFLRKPGAMNNSVALKSIPKLKSIFDTYYKQKPKEFRNSRKISVNACITDKKLGVFTI